MDYYIVANIDRQHDQLVQNEIGYVETPQDRDSINAIHRAGFDSWHGNNIADLESGTKTVLNYFDNNPAFHECKIATSTLEGRENLALITNLTTLE